ncbi:MAG: hypothetical protein KA247_00600 [Bacteroidetes bacterium]|nr:hypothetical protein [Bacteroidota bacterium]
MKTFSQYKSDNLVLVQKSIWKRIYHLKAGDEIVCTMTYPKMFGLNAVIEGFGEQWELSRPSIWKSHLDIRKQHQHLPFAKFISGKWGNGGVFELPNGERIEYAQNMWKSVNEIKSHQQVILVSLKRVSWWKSDLFVVIENESELLNKNPWIVMAVYYMILERRQQAAAAM